MSGNLLSLAKIDEYINWMRKNRYSERTFSEYQSDLTKLADHARTHQLPDTTWSEVEVAASDWLASNEHAWKPNTVRRRLASVRGYGKFNQVVLLGNYRAPKPLPPDPHPLPDGRADVVAMCEASKSPKQAALCALTGLCGLRVHEAMNLRVVHVDERNQRIEVLGKGNKMRMVPMSDTAWKYIKPAYERAKGKADDRLCPYSHSGARRSIEIQGKRAGVSRRVASHDMRSTFATESYARTNDLRSVQLLLGHSVITTTQNYVGVTSEALRKAVGD